LKIDCIALPIRGSHKFGKEIAGIANACIEGFSGGPWTVKIGDFGFEAALCAATVIAKEILPRHDYGCKCIR